MEKMQRLIIEKYKYDSKEEREMHVKEMEAQGFECSGQVRKSEDSLWCEDRCFYWYGEFSKYE